MSLQFLSYLVSLGFRKDLEDLPSPLRGGIGGGGRNGSEALRLKFRPALTLPRKGGGKNASADLKFVMAI